MTNENGPYRLSRILFDIVRLTGWLMLLYWAYTAVLLFTGFGLRMALATTGILLMNSVAVIAVGQIGRILIDIAERQ